MHVMVLGAGVTGVTTAWYLRQAGFEVSLLDRQAAAGLETSFANGGQISISHPEPWSSPSAPALVMRALGQTDAPIMWRPRASWAQWRWAAQFLRECTPRRHAQNTARIAQLALRSGACLRSLRAQLGLEYQQQTRGILHLFRQAHEWADARARQQRLAQLGIETRVCTAEECVALAPALTRLQHSTQAARLLGGLYAPQDESGNARLFSQSLSQHAADAGVEMLFEHTLERLEVQHGRVQAVWCRTPTHRSQRLQADAFVVCLGSHANAVLQPHGLTLPIYPLKGYSVTVPIAAGQHAPVISLTDESRRIVCSRLEQELRVAGMAELGDYDLSLDPARYRTLLRWLSEVFGIDVPESAAQAWSGLRPATPSNYPIIGPSRLEGLWFNTGHGTLGWTLACGSADLLTEMMQTGAENAASATR